ncbi:MAG: hypothetical protein ACHQQQ_08490 [Bacteroidota bacterium]
MKNKHTILITVIWTFAFLVIITDSFLALYNHDRSALLLNQATLIGFLKDYLNALFFLVVGIISILTYFQAKKTIFAPIKTETFKYQLKTFEEILLFFQNQSEAEFIEAMDLERIVVINAYSLLDDYYTTFINRDPSRGPINWKDNYPDLVGSMMSNAFAEKNLLTADEFMQMKEKQLDKIHSSDSDPSKWHEYEYGNIHFTTKYKDQRDKIVRFIVSPLIPERLRTLLKDFENIERENLSLIGIVLTKLAKTLPEKFPDRSSFKNIPMAYFWNQYNDKRISFNEKANEILEYINQYLQIENLIK